MASQGPTDLRRRAETKIRKTSPRIPDEYRNQDAPTLVHELQVLRTELDMQNDELIRVQEELQVSRSQYVELYESIPVGYFTFDRSGIIQHVNSAGAAMVGVSAAQLKGSPFQKLTGYRNRETFRRFCASILENGATTHTCEIQLLQLADPLTYQTVLMIGGAVHAGSIAGHDIRAVLLNITERKEGERRLEQQERDLQTGHRALQEMQTRVLTAQDDERRVLARELHDDCCQQVALLIMSIKTVQPLAAGEVIVRLRSITEQLTRLLDTMRQLAHGLHPEHGESLDLKTLFEKYLDNFTALTSLAVTFQVEGVMHDHLPQPVRTCLFRILQEALHNTLKHAEASAVTVRLSGKSSGVELSIRDDGKGFDAGSKREDAGLGLINLKERAQVLRGTLDILSRPAAGTTIQASLPLDG